jgi:chloride channel protein, CIC family
MLGGAVGQLSHQWYPNIVGSPGAFALVGMGAFFAGVAKAPIGALLMVCEMTGGYGLVVPLMLTSVVAIILSQRWGIFEKQVLNKFHSPAHRDDTVINVLQRIKVADLYRKEIPVTILPIDMNLGTLRRLITRSQDIFFPVVDENFHLYGILSSSSIRPVIFEDSVSDLILVRDLVLPPVSIQMDDNLYDALIKFLESGYGQIPIEDGDSGVIGTLMLEELMEAYHSEIQRLCAE